MSKTNERTLTMMKGFVDDRDEGLSIPEIAKKYGLSYSTVYRNLDEIAKMNGVSRDDLLDKQIIADHSGRNYAPVKPISTIELNGRLETAIKEVEILIREIDFAIRQLEEDKNEQFIQH